MKKLKNAKNVIFSGIAALALSATAIIGGVSLAASDKGRASVESNTPVGNGLVAIDTALGTAYSHTGSTVYYVSPTGKTKENGGDGTYSNPYNLEVFNHDETNSILPEVELQPGDTVYFLPGTYDMARRIILTSNGNFDNYIRLLNAGLAKDDGTNQYDGTDTVVTLDFSTMLLSDSNRGVQIYGNFYYWNGIDIRGAGDNGIYVAGSYNTIEYSEFYNNRDSGLQLGRSAGTMSDIEQWPSYNLVKNCTSHNNYDNEGTMGENADGFAAKLTIGYGNVFDGCIAYRNSDDGWDLYAYASNGNIGTVVIYNCVAFENGYLEYTQKENNARFTVSAAQPVVSGSGTYYDQFENGDSYVPFNGDGNGFKLGGSVMEGDVRLYNCLSFNNRMHGVTDNSNPGFIKAEKITSFNNSSVVENQAGDNFGKIIDKEAFYYPKTGQPLENGEHNNIDVARQTYSYNALIGVLSVKTDYAKALGNDAYRGSVRDSLLNYGAKTNVISGSIDADTKNGGTTYTSQISALNAEEIFEQLPITKDGDSYTFNVDGSRDTYATGTSGNLKENRAHIAYRNTSDHSINMGEILDIKSGVETTLQNLDVGSELNKENWSEYTHFVNEGALDAITQISDAAITKAKESLVLAVDENNVYQDFEVPITMNGNVAVSWESSDSDHIVVGTEQKVARSGAKFVTIRVYRDANADKSVELTATFTCGTGTPQTQTFNLTVKSGKPSIGRIYVTTQTGEVIDNGGTYILDQYSKFVEPEIFVENGLDYNGKLLKESQYDLSVKYYYAKTKNAHPVLVKGFTASKSGVFTVQITATLKASEGTGSGTMSYTIMDASPAADVDFVGDAYISVNRDGYTISGEVSNATGYIYAVSSENEISVTKDNIKSLENVEVFDFRTDNLRQQFTNSNANGYTIYYAIGNANGEVTSDVRTVSVSVVEVSNTADFIKVVSDDKLGEETPNHTIYRLTGDLDFSGSAYEATSGTFKALLDGNGHTVKNITTSAKSVINKVDGGTVENIIFDNITVNATDNKSGIISETGGGFLHNIKVTNCHFSGPQRVGAITGGVTEATTPLYISRIYVDKNTTVTSDATRAGGIIGHFQSTSSLKDSTTARIYISDCMVSATITSGGTGCGGIVGEYDPNKIMVAADCYLEIKNCLFDGEAWSKASSSGGKVAGMVGDHKGASTLVLQGCVSIGKLYYDAGKIAIELEAKKNASPIVGGSTYESTGVVELTSCIGLFEEYAFNIDVYALDQLSRDGIYLFERNLGFDMTVWSYIYAQGSTTVLEAPFIRLNTY